MEVIKFPATKAALWHSKPTGSPVYVHATYYRLPLVGLEERSLRLAQRFSQNHAESDYICQLVASVSTDPDAEGIRVSIDHIDPDPKHALTVTEDLILKCLVRKDSSAAASSECFKALIKAAKEGCHGKNQFGLRDVMAGMVTCYNQQGQNHIIYCDIDIVLPNVVFKATPIQSVPILTTALSKNLAGPMSLSEVQREAKSGYLTMDQTHKLLLILASDPKAISLPLVGVWVSGVAVIHDPFVWRSCLNYQFSSLLKNRVCKSPEPFLIVLYSSLRSKPEFYQCVTTEGQLDLSFELYSCHEVIHLPKKSSDRPDSPMELELTVVNSGRKQTLFEAALKTLSEKKSDTANVTPSLDNSFPWKRPNPQATKTAVVQPSVSEVTLLYEDSEPRPHPTAQSPYPSPQPFSQQPRPAKNRSKEKRKQSMTSPKASSSEAQILNNSSSTNAPPITHPGSSDTLINSYQQHDTPVADTRTFGKLQVHISPPRTLTNQLANPSYLTGNINDVAASHVGQPGPSHAVIANVQNSGYEGLTAAYASPRPISPDGGAAVYPSNCANLGQGASPALCHSPAPGIAHNCHQYQDGLPQMDGTNTHRVHPATNHSHLVQGNQCNMLHGFSDVQMKQCQGETRRKSPLASMAKSTLPNEVRRQIEHQASPRIPSHCGDGDVVTSRLCGTLASYHSDKSNSSSQFLSPQLLTTVPSVNSNTSDSVHKQNCCCNCSVMSSTHNTPVQNHPANFNQTEETPVKRSIDNRQNESELYEIVRQQEAQIQKLREQISMLLAKQEPPVPVPTVDHPPSAATGDLLNRSVGCNTSTELLSQLEPKRDSMKRVDKSIQHSDWPEHELVRNQRTSHQNSHMGFNVFENSGHLHSIEDFSNTSHGMNISSSCLKDHSEDASSLSFGEFDMNKVHDNSQESVASTMVLDLPEYGPVSPDRSVFNNQSPGGSEIGDISPVPSESVSTCEQMHAERMSDEQVTEDSRDTGLGDSHAQASLLLNDNRLFYRNVLENVYKHFLTHERSSANDTVVSAPDLTTQRSEVDEGVQRSYDDCWASPLKMSPTKNTLPNRKSKQPANVAKITKEALAKLGIEVERQNQPVSVKRDNDSVFLDLAQLPRVEYMAASLDTDSECSVEMDVLAMKYLKDDQLADLAKSKGRRSKFSHVPTTPSKVGSVSNMSLASRKYLERYGILDNDNQSAITAVTDHSLRLPTLFNVQEFLQKLSETSSVAGNDDPSEISFHHSTDSGSVHSHDSRSSRQSNSCKNSKANQPDPSQMTLNEMGQFLGLSQAFKSRDNMDHLPSASTPRLGHFPSR